MSAVAGSATYCEAGSSQPQSTAPVTDEYQTARELLDNVFMIYRNYTRGSFDQILSRNFTPVQMEYLDAVERAFYAGQVIELYSFVDTVTTNGNLINVAFHWEKKIQLYTGGGYKNLTGDARYTFRKENGSWLLWQTTGDDPLLTV